MKILLASSEAHPFSKTGGLADMVAALAKALAKLGHEVGLVTPLYPSVRQRAPGLERLPVPMEVDLGVRVLRPVIWTAAQRAGPRLYFVDQPEFFQRSGIYQKYGRDYPDNAERFIFFSKVVARLALDLSPRPDLVHLNDWQTAFAAMFLNRARAGQGEGPRPAVCFTIHNLAYQGVFPASHYALANLRWEYFTPETAEYYGRLNCLKGALSCADMITTVSPTYAREITTPEAGCGLDGLLRRRADRLVGITNGIDLEEWDPAANPALPHPYSPADLSGKTACKLALQRELGLPESESIPLFGNIGRMAHQKGLDLLLPALEQALANASMQFVLLGSGSPALEQACRDLMARYPGRVSVRVGFDEALSHRIEAGCDFFVMPSRFEPCGLNQMYSLRYGTIPIVHATGGLEDTITDIRQEPAGTSDPVRANGIKFHELSVPAVAKALGKALSLYAEPELLRRFRRNSMAADCSWDRSAAEYLQVYERAVSFAR